MALIQPCKTSAAYEAIPQPKVQLDMAAVEERLVSSGWSVLANAGVIMVVRKDGEDASIFEDGKAIIKTQERVVAERMWNELSGHYVPRSPSARRTR